MFCDVLRFWQTNRALPRRARAVGKFQSRPFEVLETRTLLSHAGAVAAQSLPMPFEKTSPAEWMEILPLRFGAHTPAAIPSESPTVPTPSGDGQDNVWIDLDFPFVQAADGRPASDGVPILRSTAGSGSDRHICAMTGGATDAWSDAWPFLLCLQFDGHINPQRRIASPMPLAEARRQNSPGRGRGRRAKSGIDPNGLRHTNIARRSASWIATPSVAPQRYAGSVVNCGKSQQCQRGRRDDNGVDSWL
jgi:hypothetical protein